MNDEEWFAVKDFDGLVTSARTLVYNNFGKWDQDEDTIVESMIDKPEDEEEFNQLLTHEESAVIVASLLKKQRNKKTQEIRYLISDETFYNMLQQLNDRLVSNTLNSLVNKGLVETGFDEKIDDFVFWVKDEKLPEAD